MRLVQTLSAAPEQYDVYDAAGIVGYIRLRWGYLTVEACTGRYDVAPEGSIALVYDFEWPDEPYKTCFDSTTEAHTHLTAGLAALAAHYGARTQ